MTTAISHKRHFLFFFLALYLLTPAAGREKLLGKVSLVGKSIVNNKLTFPLNSFPRGGTTPSPNSIARTKPLTLVRKKRQTSTKRETQIDKNKFSLFQPSPWMVILRTSMIKLMDSRNYNNILPITQIPIQITALAATSTASMWILKKVLERRAQSRRIGTLSQPKQPKLAPMNPYLRSFAFWKRIGPIVVHYKFTEFWFKINQYPLEKRDRLWNKLHDMHAPTAYQVFAEFRGVFVKLGQVLSSRPDFMPRQYIELFVHLQDSLPPKPFNDIRSMVEQSLKENQNGLSFDDVFESFDEDPLGTASIGQVHRAVLKPKYYSPSSDNNHNSYKGGAVVAVKVMHPAARKQFKNDFKFFFTIAHIALPASLGFLSEIRKQLMTEFNYLAESQSLNQVRTNMAVYSKQIKIPEPVNALCGPNLLVMEMLQGKKLADHLLDQLASALDGDMDLAKTVVLSRQKKLMLQKVKDIDDGNTSSKEKSNWKTTLHDIKSLAGDGKLNGIIAQTRLLFNLWSMKNRIKSSLNLLMEVHGHQILIDGIFNGDPHPGNILKLDDGRLGLIDYGQVKRLQSKDRVALAKLYIVLNDGIGEDCHEKIADAVRGLGFTTLNNRTDVIASLGILLFDTNACMKKSGFFKPNDYFQHLVDIDPIDSVPDSTVMVIRTVILLRGIGALLQQDLKASKYFSHHARRVLKEDAKERQKAVKALMLT